MKVLFVSLLTFDHVGGIETFNKYYIESLRINNYSTTVISYHDKKSSENIIACNSNLSMFIRMLLSEIKKNDVIVWGHVNFLPIFYFFKMLFKRKHILITHGVEVWYTLPTFKEYMINKLDFIWSVSEFTKQKLIDICNVDERKIKIFPNCIKLKNKKNFSTPYNSEQFNILTILRLGESYKLQSIINILDAMKAIPDENVVFTIIGKGDCSSYIQEEIYKRELQSQVVMKGFVEDTAPYLEHCDVFSLISDREGFGIVYLEAMEYSKPCFSAKGCGSSDVIVDQYNGFSFEMTDIEGLKEGILLLKNDTNKKNEMGRNGKDLLHAKFTFECYTKNQKTLLEKT